VLTWQVFPQSSGAPGGFREASVNMPAISRAAKGTPDLKVEMNPIINPRKNTGMPFFILA